MSGFNRVIRGGFAAAVMYHCRHMVRPGALLTAPSRRASWSCGNVQSRRNRPDSASNRTAHTQSASGSTSIADGPRCAWCDSHHTERVKRGFVGPTDDRNQYITCHDCRRVTWEIVSRTERDLRLGQFQVGDTWRDNANHTRYTISRILKVGMNEILLYVKPIKHFENEPAHDPGSH